MILTGLFACTWLIASMLAIYYGHLYYADIIVTVCMVCSVFVSLYASVSAIFGL